MRLPDYLFVYGTLRRGFRSTYRTMLENGSKYIGKGSTAGYLYQISYYPGLVLPEVNVQWGHNRVWGDIYLVSTPSLLNRLDCYEECAPQYPIPHEYSRERIAVQLNQSSRQIEAWGYIYNSKDFPLSDKRRIPSGDFLSR